MATATETTSCYSKLELRTAYGPVYRNVLNAPARDCNSHEIPVLDISDIYGDLDKRKGLAKTIRHAAENTGFFYIKNHGIDEEIIQAALAQAKTFFHQPEDLKRKVSKTKSQYFNGWSAMGNTHVSPTESIGEIMLTIVLGRHC